MAVVAARSTPSALAEIPATGKKGLQKEANGLRGGLCNKTFPYGCRMCIEAIIAKFIVDSRSINRNKIKKSRGGLSGGIELARRVFMLSRHRCIY